MSLLSVNDLSVGYDSYAVLKNINFSIESGDYLSIVGENGSGKSTLMKTLLGLLPPLSGEIALQIDPSENSIGYLPQQTAIQRDFPASVFEIVISGFQARCGLRPYYNKKERVRAFENLERLGIVSLRNRCYRELSGGQQQRVLLARALCAARKLLLLDEPVAGLDPKVTADMYELIQSLNKDGVTIIMVTHDLAAALKYSDHFLYITDNVFFGTKEEYIKEALIKSSAKIATSDF